MNEEYLPHGTPVRLKSGPEGWIRGEIVEYYDILSFPALGGAIYGGGMTPGYKVRVLEGKHKGEVLKMPLQYIEVQSGKGKKETLFPHVPQRKTVQYPHIKR